MTDFKRDVSTSKPVGAVISSPLGDTAVLVLVQNDVGKAVTFQNGSAGQAGTFEAVLCTAGDSIDGFVTSVEPFTVNDGFSFGGVQIQGQVLAEVGTTTVVLGDVVEFEAQAALGTADVPQVIPRTTLAIRTDTIANAVTDIEAAFVAERKQANWKCTQILTGDGTTQGDSILLERVI